MGNKWDLVIVLLEGDFKKIECMIKLSNNILMSNNYEIFAQSSQLDKASEAEIRSTSGLMEFKE